MTQLPWNDVLSHKKFNENLPRPKETKEKKLKIQCLFDKKNRVKNGIPKSVFIKCVPAINKNGEIIGSQFAYDEEIGYEGHSKMCGSGKKYKFCPDLKWLKSTVFVD